MIFLTVISLFSVVSAQNSGYSYQPNESVGSASNVAPSYAGQQAITGNVPVSAGSAASYGSPSGAASVAEPSFAAPAGVDKEFYSFSANDDDFIEPASSNQVDSLVNQNVRVIFIKGPERNGLEDAALALAKQASDHKTDIYVLNKQADLAELANKLKNVGDHSQSKPEVHFVKYRTPEDAANAQRAIQSEYESLGGKSQSHDGGVASSINFASAPAPKQQAAAAPSAPEASYLPASIFKRLRV